MRTDPATGRFLRGDDVQRFWSKVDRSQRCWVWAGKISRNGYGVFHTVERPHAYAHRIAYEFTFGDIPEGMVVMHACDTPACVNPAHLYVGTYKDNTQDMLAKGRQKKPTATHCKRGHEFTPENTQAHGTARKCIACRKMRFNKWQRERRAQLKADRTTCAA